MSVLQLALLILALVVIGVIGLISYRRNEAAPPEDAGSGDAPRDDSQMDLWRQESAASRFDEFGVGEPRVRSARPGEVPEAPRPFDENEPPPVYKPSLPPIQSNRRAPVVGESAAAGQEAPGRLQPQVDAAEPARPRQPLQQPARKPPEAPSRPVEQKILSLFVARNADDPMQGADVHSALRHLGLEIGPGHSYQRRLNETPWFHIASMVKPGLLDPGEAIGFTTPGLSLFLVLPGPPQPIDAFDDMLATSVRLAERLGARVLNAHQQALSESAAASLRAEVMEWAARQR